MTRTAPFWIVFTLASVAALVFAISNFSRAFPIISLDLKMNRQGALAEARTLAQRHRLGLPSPVREAASFGVDDTVKTFVELEGGGADAFRAMLRGHLYEAYTWQVRRFREGEKREVRLRFRPDGAPYGFRDFLREDAPGASIPVDRARVLAEHSARNDWGLDFTPYDLVETSTERMPGGRTDHTFVYERRDARAGEGRYRVRLVVGGDRLTELTHFLRVPEAFSRKYENMRSANNGIAFGAVVALVVLYVVGGLVLGVFLLLRQRALWWAPAMAWGFGVAALQALASINEWPLAWLGYDTAVPGTAFLTQRLLSALLGSLGDGCLVALTLTAAEGLGRRAFPRHPQLWRMWSPDAVASRQIVGRTLGGVVLTGLEFGFIIAFYLVATRLWKWWVPAEALINPDILATYLPWISAVAPSLHAGVWEEAMFRAVPLAGAALIGDRLGNRKLWIAIGLVVEAAVFGCAHANYASEPAWSRPVELILPSLLWGFIYLRFGLMPSIITHYLFDLALFALPLFTSTAAGSRIDQTFVVLCGAVPLAVVAWAVMRRRSLEELPDSLRNQAWTAPVEPELPELPVEAPPAAEWSSARQWGLIVAGVLGLAVWAVAGSFKSDAPRLGIRRADALAAGERALESRGFTPAPKWKRLASIEEDDGVQGVFVWRALGPESYRALIGKDLAPPRWDVHMASYVGDVAERAEEWHAMIRGDGGVWRLTHRLPQGRAGATLDEGSARILAHGELALGFKLDPARLKEISAESSKLPARLDWIFTFADTTPPHLAKGERRVTVKVAGDRVVDAYRFVFVPEDWERSHRAEGAVLRVIATVRGLLMAAVVIVAAALGIVAWSRRSFPVGFWLRFFAALALLNLVGAANLWPFYESQLDTAQPYTLQVAILVTALAISQLVLAAVLALVAGWAWNQLRGTGGGAPVPVARGLAAGAAAAGLMALFSRLSDQAAPRIGGWGAANSALPPLYGLTSGGDGLLTMGTAVLATLLLVRGMTGSWTRRRALGVLLLVVAGGLVVTPGTSAPPMTICLTALLAGIGLAALELSVLRYDARIVPWMVAMMAALGSVSSAVRNLYPDAPLANALGVVAAVVMAWWWTKELSGARVTAGAPTA